jgi:hypothetical protein
MDKERQRKLDARKHRQECLHADDILENKIDDIKEVRLTKAKIDVGRITSKEKYATIKEKQKGKFNRNSTSKLGAKNA